MTVKNRILFLTSNEELSRGVIKYLIDMGEDVMVCFDTPITLGEVEVFKPDFIISYQYKYIIREPVINYAPDRIINLHGSYLPWGRGMYPNFWAFVEGVPHGVTIHRIDKGIDTGQVLARKRYISCDEDNRTLSDTYKELHKMLQDLFYFTWPSIKNGTQPEMKQWNGKGTYHSLFDFMKIKHIFRKDSIDEIWEMKIKDVREIYDAYLKQTRNN